MLTNDNRRIVFHRKKYEQCKLFINWIAISHTMWGGKKGNN